MDRLCLRQIVLTGLFLLLVTPQVCQANPIIIDPVDIGMNALLFLLFDAVIDLAVLVCGFALVQEMIYVNVYDFPRYFLAVVFGGLLIDLIAIVVTHEQIAFMLLLAALAGYNAFLSRSYFGLTFAKAACIGLMIGIFTNPFLWTFQSSF